MSSPVTMKAETGQNAFEYTLVLGVVVVAIMAATLSLGMLVNVFAAASCPAVDTADGPAAVGECLATATPESP